MVRFSRRYGPPARRETRTLLFGFCGPAALILLSSAPAAAAATPPGFRGRPFETSHSYWRAAGRVRPAWFVCAPIDGADMTVVTLPDAGRRVRIVQPLSHRPPEPYRLGRADPGAGQVFWSLSTQDGREVGNIHAFNPGMLGDPATAATPTFTAVRVAGAQWDCRWLERTRLIGFTARRAVAVTRTLDGMLEYRTFDVRDASRLKRVQAGPEQTTAASLDLKGGRPQGSGFEFRNGPYAYRVAAGPSDARITVLKRGRVIASEPLLAWTVGAGP